jgi:hypothetical protein
MDLSHVGTTRLSLTSQSCGKIERINECPENAPMTLEQTLLAVARQRLVELKSYARDHETLDEVFMRYARLTGLTELAHLADSGLSQAAIVELESLEREARQIIANLPWAETA